MYHYAFSGCTYSRCKRGYFKPQSLFQYHIDIVQTVHFIPFDNTNEIVRMYIN